MSDDIDYDWGMAPRPLKPLPQVERLTAERDEWRAKCVKACVEIADRIDMTSVAKIIEHVEQNYGIRLRWTGAMFTEDTTK